MYSKLDFVLLGEGVGDVDLEWSVAVSVEINIRYGCAETGHVHPVSSSEIHESSLVTEVYVCEENDLHLNFAFLSESLESFYFNKGKKTRQTEEDPRLIELDRLEIEYEY